MYREFWVGGGGEGGAEAPFIVKMSPVFGENALGLRGRGSEGVGSRGVGPAGLRPCSSSESLEINEALWRGLHVRDREISRIGNPLTIYRGLSGPLKSLKKVSRGLRPRDPPRVWKKSRKSLSGPFRDFFQTLQTFSRLFPDSVRGRRPRETFFRLFRGFGPGGPERPL